MCWDAVFLRFGAGGTLIVPATPEKRSAEITTFFFCDLVKALWFVTTKALITPSLATVCAVAKPTPGPLSSTLCCSATERKNQRLMPALREAELPRNRHFPLPTSVCVCVCGERARGGRRGSRYAQPRPLPRRGKAVSASTNPRRRCVGHVARRPPNEKRRLPAGRDSNGRRARRVRPVAPQGTALPGPAAPPTHPTPHTQHVGAVGGPRALPRYAAGEWAPPGIRCGLWGVSLPPQGRVGLSRERPGGDLKP